jgi:hypothetical protein
MKLKTLVVLSLLISCSSWAENTLRFAGIPTIAYDPDSGFGGGAVGSLYINEETKAPTSIDGQIFLSTKGVNSHVLRVDRLRAFHLPWRLMGQIGFYSTKAQNYCGQASGANCSVDRAESRAVEQGLTGEAGKEFANRYYKNRLMSVYGGIFSRWLLWQEEAKLEFTTSYRGKYYMNRDFKEKGPYPNSLFAVDYKDKKIDGYLSLLEVGLMLDKRDNEPAPTSGYWLETSARGGHKWMGSAWNFWGLNAAARFYLPFDDDRNFVFATQTILDTTFGDLPYDAMSNIGGSQSIRDYGGIGGQFLGRGMREQMYVGRIKAIEQLEMRWKFWTLLDQRMDISAVALGDFGMTAWDFNRFSQDMKKILVGFGGGLRAQWKKSFVVRFDLAVSPEENFAISPYLVVGNVF